jgi:hypothetical protein
MAALIKSLDGFTPQQFGENAHIEYAWSNDIQESITQFSFQLTRQGRDQNILSNLSNILAGMLSFLSLEVKNSNIDSQKNAKHYLCILYKMIGQTRDIIDGKGEYMLSYMMIYTWYNYFPSLSMFALDCLVKFDDINMHPYGSWKDLKYFCQYCFDISRDYEHPLICHSIKLINEQLRKDVLLFNSLTEADNKPQISLVAKWVPREKSKYTWLFNNLAIDYYYEYLSTAKDQLSQRKAQMKCKTYYRKLLSSLNKYLDTVQIKQCNSRWSEIDPSKQTSITMNKQKFAFLNKTKTGTRRTQDPDRIICATNFENYINQSVEGNVTIKGRRIGMNDFTKSALELLVGKQDDHKVEIDLLNVQWKDSSKMTDNLGKMIAMVDVSGSMEGEPMNAAIALGIRIAEKSMLGKRVMTFSACPTWINLETCNTFTEMVSLIKRADWGMNTNFESALKMILEAIINQRLSPHDVEDMVLVILSDMQFDQCAKDSEDCISDAIKKRYHEAGMKVWNKPFRPPHILFWNLRSTSGFPCLSSIKNVSMMSGFSPALLNSFCEEGMNAIFSCTPWTTLLMMLNKQRYNILADKLNEIIV